jgi:hypothetical protein
VGKPEGERPLQRPRHRWMDNITMDLKRDRMGWDGMDWTDLRQDRDQWRALTNVVMKIWLSTKCCEIPEQLHN